MKKYVFSEHSKIEQFSNFKNYLFLNVVGCITHQLDLMFLSCICGYVMSTKSLYYYVHSDFLDARDKIQNLVFYRFASTCT